MNNLNKILVVCGIVLVFVGIYFKGFSDKEVVVSSVAQSNEYHSTTTNSSWDTFPQKSLLALCPNNVLGSVIVTGATAGAAYDIVDATSTTDTASTTIVTISSSTLGGTYTFDLVLYRGLAVRATQGNIASTTITCR